MKIYRLFSDANRFCSLGTLTGYRWWPKSIDSTLAPFGGWLDDIPDSFDRNFPQVDGRLAYWGNEYRQWSKSSAFHFSSLVVDGSLLATIRRHQKFFSHVRPLVVTRGDYDSHLIIPQTSHVGIDWLNSDILRTESGSYLASGGIEFLEEPTENLFLLPHLPFSDVYASELLVDALMSESNHGLMAELVWSDGRRNFSPRPLKIEPNTPLYSVEEATMGDRFLLAPESFDGKGWAGYRLRGLEIGILRY